MSIAIITIFSFLAAVSIVIAFVLLAQATQQTPQVRIRRRLSAAGMSGQSLDEEGGGLLRTPLYSDIPSFHRFLSRYASVRRLDLLLEQANIDISVGFFLLLSAIIGAAVWVLASNLFGASVGIALLGGGLVATTPTVFVKVRAKRRMRRFLEQLPEGLDIMAQGLQAGLGLSQAQVFVAKEMPDPLGPEFSLFIEELNLGQPIGEALKNFQRRVPLQEMGLFRTALLVQRDIGGSLAELLSKLADIIRDRFRIEGEIRTLTAQNRVAVLVVSSMPPVLLAAMFAMDPKLMHEVVQSPIGWFMLCGALVFEVLGVIWFRSLLRLHI
jgi:tight adherence protein B